MAGACAATTTRARPATLLYRNTSRGLSVSPAETAEADQRLFEILRQIGEAAAGHGVSLSQMRLLGILRDREPEMQARFWDA